MTANFLGWRKSRHSKDQECVEAASGENVVLVRDSANPAGPVISFPAAAWRLFTVSLG